MVEPKPLVKSIAIIPALSPQNYTVDVRLTMDSVHKRIGYLFMDQKRWSKEAVFDQRMKNPESPFGEYFTQ